MTQEKRSSNCTDDETAWVTPLECLGKTDLERGGGKAANLGELLRAGVPVPPGFALTTAAYERFVSANGLRAAIEQAFANRPVRGSGIRAAFEAAPVPPDVERAVLAAYQQLGQDPVAVRSSATAEDLPGASFAGQQDTYLNVIGPEALLDAVRRCWASLWTDRAIAYRASQGIDPLTVSLAVVVQRMVAAESAGVMFTANPVSGARGEIAIDASPGLGEAVVSGLVTPDHTLLRRGWLGWRVVEQRSGQRELLIRARPGGGTEQISGAPAAAAPALPRQALRRLAQLGERIQRHFGSPQDIEWAWAEGRVYILQARPITALPEPPPHANLLQRFLAANFAEMFPVRPYPLDLGTWLPALGSAVEPIFTIIGLEWQLHHLFVAEDGVVLGMLPRLPRPTWKVLGAPARFFGLVRRYNALEWQADPLLAQAWQQARDLESRELAPLAWEQLLAIVSEAKDLPFLTAGEVRRRYFPRAAFAAARLRVLLKLLGRSKQFALLLSGVENKTLEMNGAIEELASRVRCDPGLVVTFATHAPEDLWAVLAVMPGGHEFQAGLRDFFDRYGHRETVISTALEPSWKDEPAVALAVIKSSAAHPPQVQPEKPDWQAARESILAHPLLHLAPLRSAFLHLLAEARTLLQIREDTHFYATLSLPILRRTLLEMGRRLAAAGTLAAAEDVFHLTIEELQPAGGVTAMAGQAAVLRAAVQRRKSARARLEKVPLIDPRLFPQRALPGDALLRGMAGSPGVAQGPARIVRDRSEFNKLQPGDVLVAAYTNPSWTPLFQRAAAVIVDSGSPASHAAIVAREYGIPAVMATLNGTSTLQDGELIRVDGSRGMVYKVH
jgi:rifampicin phosphotransferase